MTVPRDDFDYDWLVVGSGFGGSIAALRPAERGYSVNVAECGRRWNTEELPSSTWDIRKYFHLAERRGAVVTPDRQVTDIRPIGAADGSEGYAVTSQRPGSWFRGSLRGLSPRLGMDVRTNAESICSITPRDPSVDLSDGVAVTGSPWPTDDMHIENVTYGGSADSMGLLFVPLSGDGTRLTRPFKLLLRPETARSSSTRGLAAWGAAYASRPVRTRRTPTPPSSPRCTTSSPGWRRSTTLSRRSGRPRRSTSRSPHTSWEARPSARTPAMPANPGVNPSLTISAMAERAMERIPAKDGTPRRGGVGYPRVP